MDSGESENRRKNTDITGDYILPPTDAMQDSESEFQQDFIGKLPYLILKRAFDIVASSILIVLLICPMIIIGVIVRLTTQCSALYRQERLGIGGRLFTIIKFRSMRADAESDGPRWCSGTDDTRITSFGKQLRLYHIDELPQLLLVLRGTMTFVGPRPEREYFYIKFETDVPGFRKRLAVKPGITGLAQVNGGYDLSPREKLAYDVEYIKKRSLLLDFRILLKTVAVVLKKNGAR